MPFRISTLVQDEIIRLRTTTTLNLSSIAKEVGTSRGSVQRVCESKGLNNMGWHGKFRTRKRAPSPPNCHRRFNPQESAVRIMYRNYKQGAIRRGIDFNLTFEIFSTLSKMPCNYCGLPPRCVTFIGNNAKLSGIDRVNSDLGYEESNCVPCCKLCNYAKRDMTINEFEEWIDRLSTHRFQSRKTNLSTL